MSDLFKVHILSSYPTCFFYLNNPDLKYWERHGYAVKMNFGEDCSNLTYGCISVTPVFEIPDRCIGIAPLYANRLGLKEDDVVLLSHCDVDSINNLYITPEKEEDYDILFNCKSLLEMNFLNQVSVVAEGQVLPLYVFNNVSINVEIVKLNVSSGYGRLEKFTEIMVMHPSEKPKNSTKADNCLNLVDEFKKGKQDFITHIFGQLRKILEDKNANQNSDQLRGEVLLKHLVEKDFLDAAEYKIQPSFLFLDSAENPIAKKFIVVSNLKTVVNSFGPHCVKILANVKKVNKNIKESSDSDEKKKDLFLNTYVVILNNNNDDNNNTAFCPRYIMKKLNLFAGSKIAIKQIKPVPKVEILKFSDKFICDDEVGIQFWERLGTVRENIKQTIINNIKYNHIINTLVVGGSGTGKTTLLNDIANEFMNKFLFCVIIHCKTLRGKKVKTLHQLWSETLIELACHEPSVLFIDDLHVLSYIDEEENQYNRLYSDRVVELITDLLENFQRKYNISVVASSFNMSQLSSFVSRHGPRLFQNVLEIPEMNTSERNFTLRYILNSKVSKDCMVDFDKLAGSTSGYSIQDLNDLVVKAMFNGLLRTETERNLNQSDFDLALSEWAPVNLRSVKLKKNIDIKWENVGGMAEPKKILTEVFSWPLKYPSILESCPLRLQRGVLLYGAPGTGKTLLAGALANKCELNFISVKGPEVLSKYVGASEEGVRNLFLQAEKTQPSLLFFDEFDSLAPKRGHDNTGVTDRVVNQLLTQLDGVESLNGVWVLAATSRPDLLDPALLRPGRLDKMVFCNIPNETDRFSILEVLSQNLSKAEDVNLLEIAKDSEGYTGADLQAVLYSAQMSAIKETKSLEEKSSVQIKQTHLLRALSEVKPSLSQSEKNRYNKIYNKFLNSRKMNFEEIYEGAQRVTLA